MFHENFEELLQKILKASETCFKKVYDESQKTNETLEELEIAIDNNNIDFIKLIESKTESNIINFVLNIKEKLVNIYKKSQTFFPTIIQDIQYQIQLYQDNIVDDSFEFDICTFYDIKDTLYEITNIFTSFAKGIDIFKNR